MSVPYYYDMALFTYDVVTMILIIMAECWGVRLSIVPINQQSLRNRVGFAFTILLRMEST